MRGGHWGDGGEGNGSQVVARSWKCWSSSWSLLRAAGGSERRDMSRAVIYYRHGSSFFLVLLLSLNQVGNINSPRKKFRIICPGKCDCYRCILHYPALVISPLKDAAGLDTGCGPVVCVLGLVCSLGPWEGGCYHQEVGPGGEAVRSWGCP